MRWSWCVCVLWLGAAAADPAGLHLQSKTQLRAELAGAPFEDDTAPYVPALSFSPDGHRLAMCVKFRRKQKDPARRSYIVVVSADQPNVVVTRLEIPDIVALRNLQQLVWTADGRFLTVNPWGTWDYAGVIDVDSGRLQIVPLTRGASWCSGTRGVLAGPKIVENCSSRADATIRLVDAAGNAETVWTFPHSLRILQLSQDRKVLAVELTQPSDEPAVSNPHSIVFLNLIDRKEVGRFSSAPVLAYEGAFTNAGKEFCTVANAHIPKQEHRLTCRSVATGEVTATSTLPKGQVTLRPAGGGMVITRTELVLFPFRFAGTDAVANGATERLVDEHGQHVLAQWSAPAMHDTNFASAVSESGDRVAIAKAGVLVVYQVVR